MTIHIYRWRATHQIHTDSKTNDIIFKYGEPVVPKQKVKMEMKINRNVFTMPAEMMQIDINVSPKLPEFRQSNKSRDLIKGDEQEEQQKFYIKMGTVLHSLFSTIRTRDDIEGALKQLELDGVLYDENISRDRVEKMIRKRLASAPNMFSFNSPEGACPHCKGLGKVNQIDIKKVIPDDKKI